MTTRPALACVLVFSALALLPRQLLASPIYPITVRDEWQLPQIPNCTLCHQNNLGGKGTVSTRFGRTLLSNGATGDSDTNLLKMILSEVAATNTDSDGDGIPDRDELRRGSDPNDGPGPGVIAGMGTATTNELPTPQTGCSVPRLSVASEPAECGWWLAALTAGLFLLRARRASSRD